jgi:hypothetical protein
VSFFLQCSSGCIGSIIPEYWHCNLPSTQSRQIFAFGRKVWGGGGGWVNMWERGDKKQVFKINVCYVTLTVLIVDALKSCSQSVNTHIVVVHMFALVVLCLTVAFYKGVPFVIFICL